MWHDDHNFTADDVIFTYNVVVDEKTQTAYDEDFRQINFIKKIDNYTVSVHYKYPYAPAISSWASTYILPKHLLVGKSINHSNLHEDINVAAENCSGIISNIHVSDNHGCGEEHLPPGQGIIDFPAVLQALINAGYTGPCNLECHIREKPTVEILRNMKLYAEKCISGLKSFEN